MMPIRPAGEFPSIIFLHVSFFNSPMAFILPQHWVFAIAQTQTSGQKNIWNYFNSHFKSLNDTPHLQYFRRDFSFLNTDFVIVKTAHLCVLNLLF